MIQDASESRIKIEDESARTTTVPGVMYISTIPPGVTPLHLKQVFEKYGEVGRIFLQPDGKAAFFLVVDVRPMTLSCDREKIQKGKKDEAYLQ